MKKLLSILLTIATLAMMIAAAIPAGARASFAPNGTGWDPNEVITVKKADPADVVKDGVIGDGEYERYYPDLDAEDNMTSPLFVVAFGANSLDNCLAMFPTMEYYFSWDETHGFNFAIRNKPVEIKQVLGVKEGESPEDDFCRGLAYIINFDTEYEEHPILYYALGKRTDTGDYLEGYYVNPNGPTQLGAKNTYNPTPGVDCVINYDYATGYSTVEWSVPFEDIHADAIGPGSTIKATLTATAGTAETPGAAHDDEDSYAVTLGDFGYGVNVKMMHNHVPYLLSDTMIEKTGNGGEGGGNGGQGGGTQGGGTQGGGESGGQGGGAQGGGESGGNSGGTQGGGESGGQGGGTQGGGTAPRTGDPMAIMAAVAAVSAAGAFIVRRKVRK
ncbi:MAG: hypothetical protein IKH09_09825 [Clostridia bacterium]|nr:hypothetical protein [Clostridia bacterium]